jgi:hypothetical protein
MELVEAHSQDELINKKLPVINYSTFIEKKLYKPMKELAYMILGIQSI